MASNGVTQETIFHYLSLIFLLAVFVGLALLKYETVQEETNFLYNTFFWGKLVLLCIIIATMCGIISDAAKRRKNA